MSRSLARVMMTADAVGGVWTYALDLARGFSEREIETVLVNLGPAPSASQRDRAGSIARLRLIDTGLPLEWTAADPVALGETARLLAELAQGLRPDIVHLNTPALAAAFHHPAPVVAMAHSCLGTWWRAVRQAPPPLDFAWRIAATRRGLLEADCVIAATHSFAQSLRAIYGDELPISVVLNGRTAVAMPADKRPLVFTAGRLWDEGKNIAVLDRVAALSGMPITAAGPLTGPNGERGDFAHLRLLGSLSETEIEPWYAAASIFVAPARYEPFGLAVLQAAQAGAALVLSDIPTFHELWDGAALFCPADDAAAWRDILDALLAAPERVRALGRRAQRRAALYSLEAMVRGTLDIYDRALARKTQIASLLGAAI